jgi:hypothetical protein
MTAQQSAELVALGDVLRASPRAWAALSQQEQATLCNLLLPAPTFTAAQSAYLSRWWLPVTTDQVEKLNAAAPAHRQISPRKALDGLDCVLVDLLSDAINSGPLAALLPILATLPLTYLTEIDWPIDAAIETP